MIDMMDENIIYFHFSLFSRELEVAKSDLTSLRFWRLASSFPPPLAPNLFLPLVAIFVDPMMIGGSPNFGFVMGGVMVEGFDLI